MDLQDVYSAWAAETPAGGGPLKLLGGGASAGGGAPRAVPLGGAAGDGAGPRASSGFMLTADCSAGGTLAPRAPPAPSLAPAAAAAAAAAAANNSSSNNNNAAAAAPFCFLPGTAGANGTAGARSPESEATRLAVAGANAGDVQQHLMLPAVAGRAPTTSSPEASSAAAGTAAAGTAAAAPPLLLPPPSTTAAAAAISYDFATVYALLGSLFDPACAGIDHAAALAQMPRGEREVAGVWLRSVAAHLGDPAAMAGHAAALTEATLMDRTAAGAFQRQ